MRVSCRVLMHVSLVDVAQAALQIYTHTERKNALCVTITVRRICKVDMLWVDIFNNICGDVVWGLGYQIRICGMVLHPVTIHLIMISEKVIIISGAMSGCFSYIFCFLWFRTLLLVSHTPH